MAAAETTEDQRSLTEEERRTLAAMRARHPGADPLGMLPELSPLQIPRHIAVIMDGNGRWAQARGMPRVMGHAAGAESVGRVIRGCAGIGVEALTLYSFSSENWKRPPEEVQALMSLLVEHSDKERDRLVQENIRFRRIGRREGLPPEALAALDSVEEATSGCTGLTLCVAINYGSRAEITDAVRSIARDVAAGRLRPEEIDEGAIEARLDTAGLPEPDLMIRTAGEMRLSNYLLWQLSYAELHVTKTLWPDFGEADLYAAVRDFASRTRKFGGLCG